MLTSDEKAKLWEHIAVNNGNGLQVTAMTVYNAMDDLEEQVRNLQQQNKQLIEALVIVRDTLACKNTTIALLMDYGK